ncbi:MAG: hypothetical protein WC718_07345, partial [Phycisphaerales bacterium]
SITIDNRRNFNMGETMQLVGVMVGQLWGDAATFNARPPTEAERHQCMDLIWERAHRYMDRLIAGDLKTVPLPQPKVLA